ncbi:hypothetical protein D3C86_1726590 [compost metagenome]
MLLPDAEKASATPVSKPRNASTTHDRYVGALIAKPPMMMNFPHVFMKFEAGVSTYPKMMAKPIMTNVSVPP